MTYPYTSTQQGLRDTIQQLRSSFPAQVGADTLKKWSIASNNEGVVLNVLRFLGILDEQGNRNYNIYSVFTQHNDSSFAEQFSKIIQSAYKGLLETGGEKTRNLDRDKLISFFRTEDKTSARVGKQQAMTFEVLAFLSGQRKQSSDSKVQKTHDVKMPSQKRSKRSKTVESSTATNAVKSSLADTGLQTFPVSPAFAVRVEINLPIADDQEVYDRIFRSIRENLYP